jgi:hypothetical protein
MELSDRCVSGDEAPGSLLLRRNSCSNTVPRKKHLNQRGLQRFTIWWIWFQGGILGSRWNPRIKKKLLDKYASEDDFQKILYRRSDCLIDILMKTNLLDGYGSEAELLYHYSSRDWYLEYACFRHTTVTVVALLWSVLLAWEHISPLS